MGANAMDGERRNVRLELIIHRPHGPGPFPTIVLNHGSTGIGNRPEWFKRSWVSPELAPSLSRAAGRSSIPSGVAEANRTGYTTKDWRMTAHAIPAMRP